MLHYIDDQNLEDHVDDPYACEGKNLQERIALSESCCHEHEGQKGDRDFNEGVEVDTALVVYEEFEGDGQ